MMDEETLRQLLVRTAQVEELMRDIVSLILALASDASGIKIERKP